MCLNGPNTILLPSDKLGNKTNVAILAKVYILVSINEKSQLNNSNAIY